MQNRTHHLEDMSFLPSYACFLMPSKPEKLNNFAFSYEADALELSFGVYSTSIKAQFYTLIVGATQNQYKQHPFLSETIILSYCVCLEESLSSCHLCR